MGESVGNNRLGNISSVVSSGSVDLGIILSRESTTSMWAPSSVGIDDDLSSSKTGISSWSTNVEFSGWVDDDLGVDEHLSWDDLLDDLLGESADDLLVADRWVVLGGDEDIVDSLWLDFSVGELLVLNDDLRFAVWSQPWDSSVLSFDGHLLAQLVGKNMGVWMEGLSIPLISGISEHESLITSTHILFGLVLMHRCGNIGILSVDINNNLAFVAIKTNILRGESNLSAGFSSNLLEVDLSLVD